MTNLLQILIYLPLMFNDGCSQSAYGWEVARLISTSPEQQRPALNCNSALTQAAEWRAYSLATGDYWSHCDPNGLCANEYARLAGCNLGPEYDTGNQIESLGAGIDNPEGTVTLLMGSIAHREHLTGVGPFYAAQDDIGVASIYLPGTRYEWYTVIMIADCQ